MKRAIGNLGGMLAGAWLGCMLALVIAGYAIAFDVEHAIRKHRARR